MRLRPRPRLRARAKDRFLDRKRLSLRCDPEQYSTLLWPLVKCNHSCIRQELACYTSPARTLYKRNQPPPTLKRALRNFFGCLNTQQTLRKDTNRDSIQLTAVRLLRQAGSRSSTRVMAPYGVGPRKAPAIWAVGRGGFFCISSTQVD